MSYDIVEQIGGVNVYQYNYNYIDYDTKEDKQGFITFIDEDEVPNDMKKEFDKWMHGQTMPIIDGVKFAIYSWDWERYFNLKTKGVPTYFD